MPAEKRRTTTFRTSKGTIVNVQYPDIYVSPAFLSTEDVTNPNQLAEKLRTEPQLRFRRYRPAGSVGGTIVLWHEGQQAIILVGKDVGNRTAIWVSRDLGYRWEKKYTSEGTNPYSIWGIVTKASTAIVAHWKTPTVDTVVRSTDLENWEKVDIPLYGGWWHATEDDNGNVYAHVYSGQCGVRRSVDQGKTWTFHGILPTVLHIHDLQYDPWEKRLIAVTGDTDPRYVLTTTDLTNLDPASWVIALQSPLYGSQYTTVLPKSEEILFGTDTGNQNMIIRYRRDFSSYQIGVQLLAGIITGLHRNPAMVWGTVEAFPYVVAVTNDGEIYWSEDLNKWRQMYLGCSDLKFIADSPQYLFVSGTEGVYMIPKEALSHIGKPVFGIKILYRYTYVAGGGDNVGSKIVCKGTKQRNMTIEIFNELNVQRTFYCYGSYHENPIWKNALGNVAVDSGKYGVLEISTGLPWIGMNFNKAGASSGTVNAWALLDED